MVALFERGEYVKFGETVFAGQGVDRLVNDGDETAGVRRRRQV